MPIDRPSIDDPTCGLFFVCSPRVVRKASQPFSRNVKRFFWGDAGTLSTDCDCSPRLTRPRLGSVAANNRSPYHHHSHTIHFSLCPADSTSTPPLDFGHRLTPKPFSSNVSPRGRPSNWLHGGSRRPPPSRPLDPWRLRPFLAGNGVLF